MRQGSVVVRICVRSVAGYRLIKKISQFLDRFEDLDHNAGVEDAEIQLKRCDV